MYRHFFDPIAYSEYIDALKWYAVRSNKAAENFVKEIDIAIALICKDPFRFNNSYKLFRETSLKSYPFYVVYFIMSKIKL